MSSEYSGLHAQVDALVDHFARFTTEERQLPTVWHQALLVFVQRYKHEIRAEDKAALKRVTRMQHHHQVRFVHIWQGFYCVRAYFAYCLAVDWQ